MEAITGRKTIQEITVEHAIHPIHVSQLKRKVLDGASELVTSGKTREQKEREDNEPELFQQIGRQQIDLECLKKLSCSDSRELRKLVDHDHPDLSVSYECRLLGSPRSNVYFQPTEVRESKLRIMANIDALYMEDSRSGSRRMVDYLARDGIPICRDRVGDFQERCHSSAAH
jgi:putative transposase